MLNSTTSAWLGVTFVLIGALNVWLILQASARVRDSDHLSPRNLGMLGAKLIAYFARRFSDDFQVPANSVQQEGLWHIAFPAKLAALGRLNAAIANVLKVGR